MKGDRDSGKVSTRPGGVHCSCCTKSKRLASQHRRRLAKKLSEEVRKGYQSEF